MLCRSVVFGAVLTALVLIAVAPKVSFAQASRSECETLFVQNGTSVEMTEDTLTLKGVSPLVNFFCDRPVRFAGHMTNAEYLQAWDAGKDSFEADPPNAMLSVLDGDEAHDVVVELLDKPVVSGDQFTYRIAIIEGDIVNSENPGSMFIDIIGRPLTPLSYAGVARRSTARAVRRCAVGVTCW